MSSSTVPAAKPLIEAQVGDVVEVVGVAAQDDDAHRLQAMGVCLGRRIEPVKQGDPIIIRVLGTRVGISARLAAAVMVAPPTMENSQDE